MHRVFVPASQIPEITGSDAHHIRDVLRMRAGDRLELLDGTGTVYEAEIKEINPHTKSSAASRGEFGVGIKKEKIICKILTSRKSEVESSVQITLAQALPKASKMDLIIEKCTELGVNRIIPMLTERTVSKTPKLDRWMKIAKSAAEQSGRAVIPVITPLMKFEDVLMMRDQFDIALIPWELEKERSLKTVLIPSPPIPRPSSVICLIGPEGGFSEKEVELAREAGFVPVSLGKRILRTENAGMAILSMIVYELD